MHMSVMVIISSALTLSFFSGPQLLIWKIEWNELQGSFQPWASGSSIFYFSVFLYNPSSRFSELTAYLPHIIIFIGLCYCSIIFHVQMSVCTLVASISQRNLKMQIPGPCSGDSLRSSRMGPRKDFKTALWVILINNRPEHLSSGRQRPSLPISCCAPGPSSVTSKK